MYRQGDILIERIKSLPADIIKISNKDEKIILAEGEATGHAHAITSNNALLYSANNDIFLEVLAQVDLVHEEHSTISLPIGNYKVMRQRQYTPEEIKTVLD
jgi:hypothetical protein